MTNKDIKLHIDELQSLVDIQCSEGNYNCNPYMHGLANGLILALSVLTKECPKFLDKPEKWLRENDTGFDGIQFISRFD